MSIQITEKDLPSALSIPEAVEAAYSEQMAEVANNLRRGLPTLIECDKELAPYLFMNVRDRLRQAKLQCIYLDGRQREPQQGAIPMGLMGTMIAQLRDAVRGATERRVVVLPHLDLLTTSQGGLTGEAREVIPLLYENPELVWLGFKDPSFPLPKVIENLFPHWLCILGISRNRLRHLITQKESRKFGRDFSPWQLYKYVSGVNAVRLRRLLSTLEGEDYPADPKRAYGQLRQATLSGHMEIPSVDLEKDIGGYSKVKQKLRCEILDTLQKRDRATDAEEISRLEELIPRGMIFWGPPGTGKTYFAKAIAASIGAAITIVSGPELKSKWVGESEENLRQIFHKARQSAPAIIVFDELDSFATARGTYTGSGVEHSMVNQLLTEMDGFRKEELVFVIGTTNFVEALDEALLRPGRFELKIKIPYPNEKDRRAILELYVKKFGLDVPSEIFDHIVRKTQGYANVERRMKFTGDHLYAICRGLAREVVRRGKHKITKGEVDDLIGETFEIRPPTKEEERVIAYHECGHALAAALLPGARPPEKISLEGIEDVASGYTMTERRLKDHVITERELRAEIGVLLGGRSAEIIVFGEKANGASNDLLRATLIARTMIETMGMSDVVGPSSFLVPNEKGELVRRKTSETTEKKVDEEVERFLKEEQDRVVHLITTHRAVLNDMAEFVMKKRVLEKEDIRKFMDDHGFKVEWQESPEKKELPVEVKA